MQPSAVPHHYCFDFIDSIFTLLVTHMSKQTYICQILKYQPKYVRSNIFVLLFYLELYYVRMNININSTSDLGLSVRKCRKMLKMTSYDLADIAGVGNKFLSNLENGKKESLEFGKIMNVLNVLGIKLSVELPQSIDE